MLLKKRPSN